MGSTIKLHSIIGAHTFMKDTIVHARLNTDEKCRIYSCQFDGHINLGRYTSLWGPNLHIVTGKQKVFIGNFCSIARNVYMQTYNHNSKKLSTYFIGKHVFEENWKNEKISKGDIHIENDVWIGANAMILGGITIGNGAVVASNCVVTKDVPAFAIVAGVPAKIIGYRFDEPTIKKIEEMEWWNWPIEEIKNNKHLFEEELNETDF
ncbi:MAG TPA: antibiotic acetyltransferase [Flavobacteriaceae bacterium]|nr:hypothetical protein [Flavobacteriaceae bacterium]HBR55643.1 antibiotic acetyltransferase [Flavobacteriaceae bacterium]